MAAIFMVNKPEYIMIELALAKVRATCELATM